MKLTTHYQLWREDDNQAWLLQTFSGRNGKAFAEQAYKEAITRLYPTDNVWLDKVQGGRENLVHYKPRGKQGRAS